LNAPSPPPAVRWLLRVFASLLLLAALAVLVTGLASRRGQRALELEEAGRQAKAVLAEIQDLLTRHPDFPFPDAKRRLEKYRNLAPRGQAKALAAIRRLHAELEESAVARATGGKPGGERWRELLRYKTFSPNGFRDLYESLAARRIPPQAPAPAVTGEAASDGRIVRLARARGYRLHPEADPVALVDAGGGRALQPMALVDFRRLVAGAAAEGVRLELISGFRALARQRAIFLSALAENGRERIGRAYSPGEIAAGAADAALEATLAASAPPGFSRHHTGLALDLNDPSTGRPFTDFGSSPAYRWLAADNYLNAKRFGFVPSYPPEASAQGPDPEPWEFVWVGETMLASSRPASH